MYRVYLTDYFLRQLKPYFKKFRNLKSDLVQMLEGFNPRTAVRLGQKLYKLRFSPSDFPKGKSKSFRIIVLFLEMDTVVIPVVIYFKGDQESISWKQIKRHLQMVWKELEYDGLKVQSHSA